jgi:hypothetical protein
MISIYKSKSISTLIRRFLEGDGFGLVTIPKTESQVGLAQVKAFLLAQVYRVAVLGRIQVRKSG